MGDDDKGRGERESRDEVALEMMKFIAVTTGYGKGTPTAGFGGKGSKSSEEYAEALLRLYERCRTVVANATRVLACELLCGAQGLEFHRPLTAGTGAEAAYQHIRQQVRPLGRDRTLHRDLEAVERLIRSGSLLAEVEAVCGPLQ